MAENRAPRTVLRRRAGADDVRMTEDAEGKLQIRQWLESGTGELTMAQRVRAAAERLTRSLAEQKPTVAAKIELRPEQMTVYENVALYLRGAAARLALPGAALELARFIQPPRTGKTVIIAQVIAGTGATALVLVPTENLVRQVAKELSERLPSLPIGVYYGNEKRVVRGGVNVATYQIVVQRAKDGTLPPELREATLIFCDEGHRAMSAGRMMVLRTAFDDHALRIACTATADWNDRHTLSTYFPTLIHEITLQEAVELDLFAQLKVWVLSVAVDGSSLKIVNGDYDPIAMSKLMAEAPALEAARHIRYETDDNAMIPALVCCVSVKQAQDVHRYLCDHRPAGSPKPALVLGKDKKDRRRILEDFEAGRIDTIVNVGVLLEGWDSPSCKLLIDLAPTLSEVRAKQKYFRVMTKCGDAVAKIYVLLPQQMRRVPILPQALFGNSIELEGYEEWLRSQARKDSGKKKPKEKRFKLEKLRVRLEVLHTFNSALARLNPKSRSEIREVLESAYDWKQGFPRYGAFLKMPIAHHLFSGCGADLLRYCGVRRKPGSYLGFVGSFFLDNAADRILAKYGLGVAELPSCEEDAQQLRDEGWVEFLGQGTEASTEELVEWQRILDWFRQNQVRLSDRQRYVLTERYGLDGSYEELTLDQVGRSMKLSKERVRGIEKEAVLQLRCLRQPEIPGRPTEAFSWQIPDKHYRTYPVWVGSRRTQNGVEVHCVAWKRRRWYLRNYPRLVFCKSGALLAETLGPISGIRRTWLLHP